MVEIFETVMLLCFGFSWPVSLIKNLRAGSARSTSIAFMCLILTGYAAGIVAKVLSVGCNFVFFVYVFNVVMVLANLTVTLRNRVRDRKKGRDTTVQKSPAVTHLQPVGLHR